MIIESTNTTENEILIIGLCMKYKTQFCFFTSWEMVSFLVSENPKEVEKCNQKVEQTPLKRPMSNRSKPVDHYFILMIA